MAGAKLIVIYPRPKDIEAFEHVYQNQHVPMAVDKLAGKTKIVASKIVGSPQGAPPFYRIAEIHFPTMEALQACAASDGGKQTIANAVAPAARRFSWSPKRKPLCSRESKEGGCATSGGRWGKRFRRMNPPP
jgi:uncharacterized protein (TIGR02118 family)